MRPMKVLLAEDHHLIREALRALLEEMGAIEVVGQARDGVEALQLAESLKPDLVVMDVGMPNLNGMEATRRMRQLSRPPDVIILSQYGRNEYVVQALLAGARAYLLKDSISDELVEAIEAVSRGEMYLSEQFDRDEIMEYVRRGEEIPSPLARLTPRERQVLQLVAEGHTNRQVAVKLSISVKTVEKHRFNLMDKLDIRDVTGLVRFAVAQGIVPAPNTGLDQDV